MEFLETSGFLTTIGLEIIRAKKRLSFSFHADSPFMKFFSKEFLSLCNSKVHFDILISGLSKEELFRSTLFDNIKHREIGLLKSEFSIDYVIIDQLAIYIRSKDDNRIIEMYEKDDIDWFMHSIIHNKEYKDAQLLYSDADLFESPQKESNLISVSQDFYERIVQELRKNPNKMYDLDPFEFEGLVAKLLIRKGYDVQITPRTKDGGKDIIAKFKAPTGDNLLCLIECKRYSESNPVGISLIRALYGTIISERANLGMLVTTSRFTKDAKIFQGQHKSQISLKDYSDLTNWLKE